MKAKQDPIIIPKKVFGGRLMCKILNIPISIRPVVKTTKPILITLRLLNQITVLAKIAKNMIYELSTPLIKPICLNNKRRPIITPVLIIIKIA